jgi:UDP-glucose 4-epimerase
MHVLITGGAGFIGSHSTDALLKTGARVAVLDNFSTGRRENLPFDNARLSVIEGDIRVSSDVESSMRGVTHLLHLAAQVSVKSSVADPIASCSHNVVGFLNVLEAARRHGIQRFVYASSAAVYGVPQSLPLREDSPLTPISPYGLEKWIDERYAALYQELYGMKTIGLRYFNVYGPRQSASSPYAGVITKFAAAISSTVPVRVFGDGQQTRDFVFVRDVAKTNVLALASELQGVCNVGTGRSVSLLELITTLEQIAGKGLERRFEPTSPGDISDSGMSPDRLREWFGEVPETALHVGLSMLLKNLA